MTREQAKTLIKDMRARETAHRVLFGGEVTPMRSGDLLERPQAIETNLTLGMLAFASVLGVGLWALAFWIFCHREILAPIAAFLGVR